MIDPSQALEDERGLDGRMLKRCPCGCGIFVYGDDWYERHYDEDHRCKMCGEPSISSRLRPNVVTLRTGETISCPLCNLMILDAQLQRHARELVEARKQGGTK